MKIGFIGAGKAGKALGLYFKVHTLDTVGYYSKTLQSAQRAAEITGTKAFSNVNAIVEACEVLFITTSDQALSDIDRQISEVLKGEKRTCIHVSGAFSSDCLVRLKREGCPVGSMHPLQSFGEPVGSSKQLENTFFSIEGTQEAVQTIKNILKITGGRYNEISSELKPIYHAGACMLSNYLVTLLDCGMRYMEKAGMDRNNAFETVQPLIQSTLTNILEKGTKEALTGPIARGDFNTVTEHLQTLEKNLPSEFELYKALALSTVKLAQEKSLTEEQGIEFKKLIEGSGSIGK